MYIERSIVFSFVRLPPYTNFDDHLFLVVCSAGPPRLRRHILQTDDVTDGQTGDGPPEKFHPCRRGRDVVAGVVIVEPAVVVMLNHEGSGQEKLELCYVEHVLVAYRYGREFEARVSLYLNVDVHRHTFVVCT